MKDEAGPSEKGQGDAYHWARLIQVNSVGLQSRLLGRFIWILQDIRTIVDQSKFRNAYPAVDLELL